MFDITPTNSYPKMYDFISEKVIKDYNPAVLVILSGIILVYYLLFSYLGVAGDSEQPPSMGMRFIEIILWGLFIFLILINGLQYFLNIDLKAGADKMLDKEPQLDISINKIDTDKTDISDNTIDDLYVEKDTTCVDDEEEEVEGGEVFHMNDNKYSYSDAKALCKAYGAKLATYKQVEDAYDNGGEWCGYGWSEDQMALYPTQHSTWKKLNKIEGHENDCGRPGINGGYIENENVKFGVNCFGIKPKSKEIDRHFMENNDPTTPVTKEQKEFEDKVKKYKKKKSDILISPFNYGRWGE